MKGRQGMKTNAKAILAAVAAAVPAAALAAGEESAAGTGMTWAEILERGGVLMYVLGALSVVGLALIVYYAMVLRVRSVAPEAQILRLRELLKERRGADAREECAKNPTALASVTALGLDFLKENPAASAGALKEIMESEGGRQAGRMQNMIHYLLDLSSVAPMVGLLGTVLGMLRAFNSVALDVAAARPQALAEGVGQALVTTVAGLVVAIPALIAWAIFRGRVGKLIGRLEVATAELMSIMDNRGA